MSSQNVTASKKSWSEVAATSKIDDDADQFVRDTEVQVKLVVKPSREYIYELLTKTRFPLTKIEAIIERRSNTVDFTCKDRSSAENLQRLLGKHPNVREARLFESEYIDVKLTGVPHRLPDSKIIAFLVKRNGEVISTKRLKDRKGYYDGRRIYKMRTAELQRRPIPQLIRVCECSIRTDYYGQPTQCYLCKKYGHMRHECPDAVRTPPMLFFEGEIINQLETNKEDDNTTTGHDTSTPIQRTAQLPQASKDKNLHGDDSTPNEPAAKSQHQQEDGEPAQEIGETEANDSEFSSSSSELDDMPDQSVFNTDEEDIELRLKRRHSPDEHSDKKPKQDSYGETIECKCGYSVMLPCAAGPSAPCTCGMFYTRCGCENVVATYGDMPANCDQCRKPVLRRHLDMTM